MPYPVAAVRGKGGTVQSPWYVINGAPMAVWQPKGATSYAASKINLINPGTRDLADGAAYPTWGASYGWSYDANSSQYLLSDIKPNYGTFDVCTIVRVSDFSYAGNPINSRYMFGNTNYKIYAWYSTNRITFNNGASGTYLTSTGITSGVFGINGRGGNDDEGAYMNGAKLFDIVSSGAGSNAVMAVGANGATGTISNYFNGKIQAMIHYNRLLTAAEVAAVSAAMALL